MKDFIKRLEDKGHSVDYSTITDNGTYHIWVTYSNKKKDVLCGGYYTMRETIRDIIASEL